MNADKISDTAAYLCTVGCGCDDDSVAGCPNWIDERCTYQASEIQRALSAAYAKGMAEGLQKARDEVSERAREYARAANEHQNTELGVVYTDKCGVCASISSRIDARLSAIKGGEG